MVEPRVFPSWNLPSRCRSNALSTMSCSAKRCHGTRPVPHSPKFSTLKTLLSPVFPSNNQIFRFCGVALLRAGKNDWVTWDSMPARHNVYRLGSDTARKSWGPPQTLFYICNIFTGQLIQCHVITPPHTHTTTTTQRGKRRARAPYKREGRSTA